MPDAICRRLMVLSQKGYFIAIEDTIVQTYIIYLAIDRLRVAVPPSAYDDFFIGADMSVKSRRHFLTDEISINIHFYNAFAKSKSHVIPCLRLGYET